MSSPQVRTTSISGLQSRTTSISGLTLSPQMAMIAPRPRGALCCAVQHLRALVLRRNLGSIPKRLRHLLEHHQFATVYEGFRDDMACEEIGIVWNKWSGRATPRHSTHNVMTCTACTSSTKPRSPSSPAGIMHIGLLHIKGNPKPKPASELSWRGARASRYDRSPSH